MVIVVDLSVVRSCGLRLGRAGLILGLLLLARRSTFTAYGLLDGDVFRERD